MRPICRAADHSVHRGFLKLPNSGASRAPAPPAPGRYGAASRSRGSPPAARTRCPAVRRARRREEERRVGQRGHRPRSRPGTAPPAHRPTGISVPRWGTVRPRPPRGGGDNAPVRPGHRRARYPGRCGRQLVRRFGRRPARRPHVRDTARRAPSRRATRGTGSGTGRVHRLRGRPTTAADGSAAPHHAPRSPRHAQRRGDAEHTALETFAEQRQTDGRRRDRVGQGQHRRAALRGRPGRPSGTAAGQPEANAATSSATQATCHIGSRPSPRRAAAATVTV